MVIVGEDGKVQWRFDMPASDGWVLPNGNVLLALYGTKGFPNGGVAEVNRKTKEIVWSYKGQQKEISTVQPLGDGKYLVAELGPEPRAIVINRAGKILKSMVLACQKQKRAHANPDASDAAQWKLYRATFVGFCGEGIRTGHGQSASQFPD